MIRVLVRSSSRYKIERKKIAEKVREILAKEGILAAEVGINFVGRRKMKALNSQFRGREEVCAVLSFPLERGVRGGFVNPPDGVLHLGDVVLCFPEAVKLAAEEGVLVEGRRDGRSGIEFPSEGGIDI